MKNEDILRDQVTNTSLTAAAIAALSVTYADLSNGRDIDGVKKCFELD